MVRDMAVVDPERRPAQNAGKFLSARRSQKQHEFKAEYYRMKARLAQLESFITKAGLAIPEEFE